MFRTAFVVLVTMACTQARPQVTLPVLPTFQFPSTQSAGQSNSAITKGETITPSGKSTVVQQQANTGGQASKGGLNVGTASTDTQSMNTPHGTSSSSNTDAQSVQGSIPAFNSLGGGLILPSIPVFPDFELSNAQGQAGSNIVKGDTIGPHGGKSTIAQQQSGTGGQASNGGFNLGKASSDTQSQSGLLGTSSSSNTDAQSVQVSNPAFPILGGGLGLPIVPVFPVGFGSGSASGHSNSGINQGETIGPFGGKSTVVQMQSGTGGEASNGGSNFGTASSDTQSLNTPHGTSSSSNTDAKSVQGSLAGTFGFGSGLVVPSFPSISGFGFGSATGKADSGLTQSKTTGADGSQSTVTVLGSSAGGSAKNGGTSVNKASGSTSSIDGISGSQTQSHLDSESKQTGR